MKKNNYSINLIGHFFCFCLLAFFSFQSNAYPAASSYYDTVQKTYIGYYQRPADPGGLIYWADRLDKSGGNIGEIIEAFANSAEAQALYGTINSSNISTVVNDIYITLFGRPAEEDGINYYVNGFNTGRFTAATIMLNVLYGATQGADYLSVTNKLAAANLFTRTIDPELDGSNFQVTYAGSGAVIAARNFLTLYATSVKVPTQAETTAYLIANIAAPNDLFTINYYYLQYRNYEDSTNNSYVGIVSLTKGGAPMEPADVVSGSGKLTDSAGKPVIPYRGYGFFSLPRYYTYDCRSSPCSLSLYNLDRGVSGYYADLPADDYHLEFSTANGQKLTMDIAYPGQLVLPFVASATMQAKWSSNGDLVLSWTNPTGDANWAKVDEVRILVFSADANELIIHIKANRADETVTIPASLVRDAGNLGHGALKNWHIETRAFDANGLNIARGYSKSSNIAAPNDLFANNYYYIQYRSFEESANNFYLGIFSLTKGGAPMEAADVVSDSGKFTDSSGKSVTPYYREFFSFPPYYTYDCRTFPCSLSLYSLDRGVSGGYADLPADDYHLEFSMVNGQKFTIDIAYPGQLVLPTVASATMQAKWSSNGDLVLSWTNPTGDANWTKVYDLRIWVFAADDNLVIHMKANRADETVTIPASLVSDAKNLGHGALKNWHIETRAFDVNGLNIARGYSRMVAF